MSQLIRLKDNGIKNLSDIIGVIPMSRKDIDVIDLEDNNIKYADLSILPEHISHVNLTNNSTKEVNFGEGRKWGVIVLKNNSLDIPIISNLKCMKLDLSENLIDDITLISCEIDELILCNNSLRQINLIECSIKKLDISSNKLTEISHYPEGLVSFIAVNNRINNVSEFPETLKVLDLKENKLREIPNIPKTLVKLDLSKNKLNKFDISMIPEGLDFLDVTDNMLQYTDELFGPVRDKIEMLCYDEFREELLEDYQTKEGNESKEQGEGQEGQEVPDDDSDFSIKIVRPRVSRTKSFESVNSTDAVDNEEKGKKSNLSESDNSSDSGDSDDSNESADSDVDSISQAIHNFKKKQLENGGVHPGQIKWAGFFSGKMESLESSEEEISNFMDFTSVDFSETSSSSKASDSSNSSKPTGISSESRQKEKIITVMPEQIISLEEFMSYGESNSGVKSNSSEQSILVNTECVDIKKIKEGNESKKEEEEKEKKKTQEFTMSDEMREILEIMRASRNPYKKQLSPLKSVELMWDENL